MSNTGVANDTTGGISTQHEPIHTSRETHDDITPAAGLDNNVEKPPEHQHHRSDSHGSHGDTNEHGIKKILHKLSDKMHPYDKQVEKESLAKSANLPGHNKDEMEGGVDLNRERRSNGGYI